MRDLDRTNQFSRLKAQAVVLQARNFASARPPIDLLARQADAPSVHVAREAGDDEPTAAFTTADRVRAQNFSRQDAFESGGIACGVAPFEFGGRPSNDPKPLGIEDRRRDLPI